jgi:PIN domain nuclease of toxin-antitoxin system
LRLLLDTHVLLWWLFRDRRLGRRARAAIEHEADEVVVSAATAWEMAIEQALGRLDPPQSWPGEIATFGFGRLSITFEHAAEAGSLPRYHADPFDRMLIAQARIEGLTIVTADPRISRYDVPTMAP